jgi:hypothetical protein
MTHVDNSLLISDCPFDRRTAALVSVSQAMTSPIWPYGSTGRKGISAEKQGNFANDAGDCNLLLSAI